MSKCSTKRCKLIYGCLPIYIDLSKPIPIPIPILYLCLYHLYIPIFISLPLPISLSSIPVGIPSIPSISSLPHIPAKIKCSLKEQRHRAYSLEFILEVNCKWRSNAMIMVCLFFFNLDHEVIETFDISFRAVTIPLKKCQNISWILDLTVV